MSGFTARSLIVLAVVAAVVVVAAVLLQQTMSTAQSISDTAEEIRQNGRGINSSTDSVMQLQRTNRLAGSILQSASPLERKLDQVVAEARGINGVAGRIDSTAGQIDGTAAAIDSTAGDINANAGSIDQSAGAIDATAGEIDTSAADIDSTAGAIASTASAIDVHAAAIDGPAAGILHVARLIDRDAQNINENLDVTIRLAGRVRTDTGNILREAEAAHQTGTCIDRKLGGRSGNDSHCDQPRQSRR